MRDLVVSRLRPLVSDVVEASDGLEAWRLLSEGTFDLALVDLMMPNLDGYALIQCVRGHPRTRHLPIVVVTSKKDATSIAQALEMGASAFLTKPVTWSAFDAHMLHLMRLSRGAERAEAELQHYRAVSAARLSLAGSLGDFSRSLIGRIRNVLEGPGDPHQRLECLIADLDAADAECSSLIDLAASLAASPEFSETNSAAAKAQDAPHDGSAAQAAPQSRDRPREQTTELMVADA